MDRRARGSSVSFSMESQTGWMFCLARSSPKLFRLSTAPSALILTVMPETDLRCARALNSASLLGSGENPNEPAKPTKRPNPESTIAAATIMDRVVMILDGVRDCPTESLPGVNLESCDTHQHWSHSRARPPLDSDQRPDASSRRLAR